MYTNADQIHFPKILYSSIIIGKCNYASNASHEFLFEKGLRSNCITNYVMAYFRIEVIDSHLL